MGHPERSQKSRLTPVTTTGPLALLLLTLLFPFQALGNAWLDSFGQKWFYEVSTTAGEVLAGAWWSPALEEGESYTISFDVTSIRGQVALYVGDLPRVVIDSTGSQSIDFSVAWGGRRRMVFASMNSDVTVGVSNIVVAPRGSSQAGRPSRGHYLSFARERNLLTEVVRVMANPWSYSGYHRNIANKLDGALTTPGVKGFQVTVDWRNIETGDGVYNWRLLDDNLAAARRYGLAFVVKVLDRSFDGSNPMPAYFSSARVLWTTGGGSSGFVSKRWDPYVYSRIIRLYRAIANRYDGDPAFAGIATTESALGNFGGSDYTVAKYKTALRAIATQTQDSLTTGKLFWYMNFIRGNNTADMNKDTRVHLAQSVPGANLAIGGPDVTPDVKGMPGSVSSYRIHVRNQLPGLDQFCHLQHVDLGLSGQNVKNNYHRQNFLDQIARVRERESMPGFNGTPAEFVLDDLRSPSGSRVDLHPNWVLGNLWTPVELFDFADRNFQCDYFFWNYVDSDLSVAFGWPDIQPVILETRSLYE